MDFQWDTAYKTGRSGLLWDSETPTPELVATVATQGVAEGKRALDLGCGGGTEAIFLAKSGYEVIGVDLSEEALRIAENRAKASDVIVDWKRGNVLQLPLESDTIDFINDRGCFHIIPASDRSKYVGEVTRLLKAGGTFLLRGISKPLDKTCDLTKEIAHILQEGEVELPPFEPITEEVINELFPSDQYFYRGVFPLTSSEKRSFPMNMVYLKKL